MFCERSIEKHAILDIRDAPEIVAKLRVGPSPNHVPFVNTMCPLASTFLGTLLALWY